MSSTITPAAISVLLLLWSALHVACWINPRFRLVLHSHVQILELLNLVGVEFCPSLLPVLQASTPPSIDWLLSLPSADPRDRVWGVYILVLRKPDCRYKLYISSATAIVRGVRSRFNEYDKAKHLPRHINNPLKEGFDGDPDVSEEQLQQIGDDIKAKNIEYGRAYHKQQCMDATSECKAARARANKKQRLETQQPQREARQKKTFYCDLCHYAVDDTGKLKDRTETKRHKRRVQERSGNSFYYRH